MLTGGALMNATAAALITTNKGIEHYSRPTKYFVASIAMPARWAVKDDKETTPLVYFAEVRSTP
jgi:hypothetical protein